MPGHVRVRSERGEEEAADPPAIAARAATPICKMTSGERGAWSGRRSSRQLAQWASDYNHERPHSSLGGSTPAQARRASELLGAPSVVALAPSPAIGYQAAGLLL